MVEGLIVVHSRTYVHTCNEKKGIPGDARVPKYGLQVPEGTRWISNIKATRVKPKDKITSKNDETVFIKMLKRLNVLTFRRGRRLSEVSFFFRVGLCGCVFFVFFTCFFLLLEFGYQGVVILTLQKTRPSVLCRYSKPWSPQLSTKDTRYNK